MWCDLLLRLLGLSGLLLWRSLYEESLGELLRIRSLLEVEIEQNSQVVDQLRRVELLDDP